MSQKRPTQISDFIVARRVLELVCRQHNCSFRDLEVKFDTDRPYFDPDAGAIRLSDESTLPQTIYSIISVYVDCLELISGRSLDDEASAVVKNFAIALVRDFTASPEGAVEQDRDDAHAMRLDQFAFVWMFLRNVVCPYANLPLENIRIIAGHSATVDGAVYVADDNETVRGRADDKYPLIFVNLDMEVHSVRSAFLLFESIRYLCDKADCETAPDDLLRSIVFESSLKDRLIDFVGMAYPDPEDAADFFATLSILCNSEDMEEIALRTIQQEQDMVRTAQGMADNWWFLGLTEKMLEPARSEDWTVYELWKPFTEELWKKVETERRLRGLDEVPFDLLLRIQADMQREGYEDAKGNTIQGLLSETRIW